MCATVLTVVLSVGCTQSDNSDDPNNPNFEEGVPTEVLITLSAPSGNATRADGTAKDPTSSVELIHNWWLAFINKGNKEVTIVKDTDKNVYDKVTSTTTVENPEGGYEAQTFRIVLPAGKYRIYAFANITPPENKEDFVKLLNKNYKLEGRYINDFVEDAFTGNSNNENDGMQWLSTKNIPMTKAMDEKTISNTVEEAFNIEVIRTVAKVEFVFSNPSTDEITVNELKFGPIINSNEISISPNDKYLGESANIEDLRKKSTGTLTFPNMDKTLDPNGGSYDLEFYCKESLGGWYDKDGKLLEKIESNKPLIVQDTVFRIDLKVTKTKAGETTEKSETKTFYTKDIKYINRNDWIYIPIKFNNWVIKWKLHYYPPIGGYPPVFNQDAEGTRLQATLTTGGEFELYPVEVLMNGTSYKVDMNNADMAVSVTSGDEIFITKPQIMDNPNLNVTGHPLGDGTVFPKIIAGELDPKTPGKAEVKITFYLDSQSGITDALDCTFTINRKNGTN